MIHGSGPNDRDAVSVGQLDLAFGFEIPIFADALQEAGFAVLTYDKRTCGAFNDCADNGYVEPSDEIVVDDFIADAEAAVAFLREQPEIDSSRVSVVGHSQGVEFVNVMLAADSQLEKGAMLAGPYSPIDELMEVQLASTVELLESLGMSEEQALSSPGVSDLAVMLEGLEAIRAGGSDPVGGIPATFWNSWFELGQAKLDAVPELGQPVLILAGALDWNVSPSEAEARNELFEAAGKVHTTTIIECVTHALNRITERDVSAIAEDDIGKHVAPEVLDALIDFLAE